MNKQKAFLLFIALLINMNLSYCQESKIDSLKKVIENSNNLFDKSEALRNLSVEMFYSAPYEETKPFLDSLIVISKEAQNNNALSDAYKIYSTYGIFQRNKEESISYAKKAIKLNFNDKNWQNYISSNVHLSSVYGEFDEKKMQKEILLNSITFLKGINIEEDVFCDLYTHLGHVYLGEEDEISAIDNYKKSIDCSDKKNKPENYINVIRGLAWIYIDRKEYKKAEEYVNEAILISEKKHLLLMRGILQRILGRIYFDTGKVDKSIEVHKQALEYFKIHNNPNHIFDISNQISNSYLKKENLTKALDYASEALVVANKLNDAKAINSSKMTLSDIYIEIGNINKSNTIIKELINDTINSNNWPSYLKIQLYQSLIKNYKKNNNYKEAFRFKDYLSKYNDSLSDARFKNNLIEIDTKYQTERKEKENLQLKADKAEQAELLAKENKRKWLLGAGLLTALLALAVFTFYYRRNKKQKEVIESLQKELHHRIKNNLSIIDTFIEVAKEEFEDPKFSKKLTELQNRIDSINEVHQQLYKNKDVTNLNLKNYIDTLAKNVESSFSNNKITIEKTVKDQLHLHADKSFPVGLIINEFLTNSYKYAFDTNEGKVKIEMNDLGSDYQLLLSDNGKGLPENFDLKTSDTFGLRIMKLLTEQLNGDFQLSNDHGVNLTINFPK